MPTMLYPTLKFIKNSVLKNKLFFLNKFLRLNYLFFRKFMMFVAIILFPSFVK